VAELSAAQRKVDRALREMRAMTLLSFTMIRKIRDRIDSDLEMVPKLRVRELRIVEEALDGTILEMRDELGAIAPIGQYTDIIAYMESAHSR
jgi:hypothetical protein